ncbi:MAG: hypothetical protein J6P44_07185 [Bacteroidales bacterium]|nr:hypothetical protein [Bacteroidales bacterium]
MKKRLLTFTALICSIISLNAQSNYVDQLYFNARGSFNFQEGKDWDDKGAKAEFFNFNMSGHIADNITYRVRQRFTKTVTADNPLNATDFLYFNWDINEKWSMAFGKQEIFIGGFEYDYAPIDVYFYSDFCNTLPECYSFAASVFYNINKNQQLVFQLSNSPYYADFSNKLSYNLAWFGNIAPWWKTIWSVNEVEFADGKYMNYIALGNQFSFGDFTLDVDFMNQYCSDYDDFFFTDWNIVGKLNYNYKDFNFFCKGGYDKTPVNAPVWAISSAVYDGDYSYIGGGLEYFPLKNKDLRLHAVYYWQDKAEGVHNISIGATWQLNVINKK